MFLTSLGLEQVEIKTVKGFQESEKHKMREYLVQFPINLSLIMFGEKSPQIIKLYACMK